MKKYLVVYYGDAPECVEGFNKECERSCKGALHVKPGRKMTITEDELKHIKECHKHMLPKFKVLAEKKAKKVEPKKEVAKAQAQDEGKKSEPVEAKPVMEAPAKKARKRRN